jgi:regulator of replication initiation timing
MTHAEMAERIVELERALGVLANALLHVGAPVVAAVQDNELLRELVKARREQLAGEETALVEEQRRQRVAQRAEKEAKWI